MIPVSHRRFLVPPCLLVAALAMGCGGSSDSVPAKQAAPANQAAPPEQAAAKIDACTLFTYEDAQAIAGESVATMASTLDEAVGRTPGQCIYNSGSTDQPRILSLEIRQHRRPKAAKRKLRSNRRSFASMSGGNVQDISGLGDGALWVGGRIQQLHVLAGSRQLIVTVQSPDGTDQLPQARRIAVKALESLKSGQQ